MTDEESKAMLANTTKNYFECRDNLRLGLRIMGGYLIFALGLNSEVLILNATFFTILLMLFDVLTKLLFEAARWLHLKSNNHQ